MYKQMHTRTWEPHRGPDRKRLKETELLETRSTAETGLRWFLEMDSYCQESRETGKADISRRLGGSRIKHSTLSVGEPRTRGRI
jgi:hypothetical protein